jgi:hypothetical protein
MSEVGVRTTKVERKEPLERSFYEYIYMLSDACSGYKAKNSSQRMPVADFARLTSTAHCRL